jgi:DNA-directed RNA polymerase specialized sigma24 family protein
VGREAGGCADSDEELSGAVLDRVSARAFLGQVPAADRTLLARRYLLDQSAAQIAAELEMPASTVRVRLHRAVARFREYHGTDGGPGER